MLGCNQSWFRYSQHSRPLSAEFICITWRSSALAMICSIMFQPQFLSRSIVHTYLAQSFYTGSSFYFLNIIKVWNILSFWQVDFILKFKLYVTLACALFMQNILRILNLELQGCWSLRKVIQKIYSYLDSQQQEIFSHSQLRTGLVQVFIKVQSLNLLLHLQK